MASKPHSGSTWTRAVWSNITGIASGSIYPRDDGRLFGSCPLCTTAELLSRQGVAAPDLVKRHSGYEAPERQIAHGLVRIVRDPLAQVLKDCMAFRPGASTSNGADVARVRHCVADGNAVRQFVQWHCDVAKSADPHRQRCVPALSIDYDALVGKPQRGFERLVDFAMARATPPRHCLWPNRRPWVEVWNASSVADRVASALRAFPPGLKDGRARPSAGASGHWDDLSDAAALAARWRVPDAARLKWLAPSELRSLLLDLGTAAANCRRQRAFQM